MQESKNCELLFEYLRSILYDTKIETLNIFDLDEPYRKLGQGLQFLENAIGEMNPVGNPHNPRKTSISSIEF